MKTIFSLIAVLALCAAVVAQDAPEQPEKTPIKPLELYKQVGRSWSFTVTEWKRGEGAEQGRGEGKVTEVSADAARYKESLRFRTRSTQSDRQVQFGGNWGSPVGWDDEALPEEVVDVGFASFVCRRHVKTEDEIQTTTWVSAEYHPLIVKQIKLGKDSCEIRKLKSFDSAEVDQLGIYKVVGRRIQVSDHGKNRDIVVTSHSADQITVEHVWLDEGGRPESDPKSDSATLTEIREDLDELRIAGPVRAETVKVKAGEFACSVYESDGQQVWLSSQWPALIVKTVEDNEVVTELLSLDLGHDEHKLYRTAGNYSVTRSVTSFGELEVESQVRVEVTSFEEGVAKVVTIYQDGEGNEQLRRDMDRPIKELELPAMPYNGQIEESATTPAGTFRCIKTEVEGVTTWTHHGVIVRMVAEQQGAKVTQELIELKME